MPGRGVEARAARGDGLPRRFGRYELTGLLGEGGMGRVYRATLTGPSGFRKQVALKVIRPREGGDADDAVQSFIQEARVCGLLRHPNVVDVYDFGVTDGEPWLAMELVDGWPLDALIAEHELLPPTVALDVAIQIAEGLLHAHELEDGGRLLAFVHRDLKPANVLVTRQGLAKVMDFGLAMASQGEDALDDSGVVRGTPAYMSPEQASGDELDPRSDLFSFGILLYELAVGERPFQRDNVIAMVMALVQVEDSLAAPAFLARPDARIPGLAPILRSCMRRDPEQRVRDARALLDGLRGLLRAQPPGPSLRSWTDAVLLGNAPRPLHDTQGGLPSAALTLRGNVQSDGTPFVGRAEELAALGALVQGGARLIAVVGAAGTGKSRLAGAFVAAQREYLDAGGAWFCDLSGATDLLGVLAAVAAPLGVPLDRARGEQAAIDQVGYAIAGRGRVVLILDNVEQVLDAAGRAARRWSEIAQEAVLLVTSRERVRWPGAREVEVGPLSEADAVGLFLQRARAQRPDVSADPAVLARIVKRLDRLPLAIELAAARARLLSPEQILERLSQRFTLLTGGSGRQGTLRAAIEWSWNLLSPEEQQVLAWCSVFRGTFDLAAVESVVRLEGVWVLDVIEALRDKSLVQAEQLRELGGAFRFRLFESIRVFAHEQLDEPARAWERHASHYVTWGEQQVQRLDGPLGGVARAELAHDLDNLHAAFARHASSRPRLAVRAALVMSPVLLVTGPLDGHVALIERAVGLAEGLASEQPDDELLLARLLLVRGGMRSVRASFSEAEADLRRGLGIARAMAARHLEGELLGRLGRLLLDKGATSEGQRVAEELSQLASAIADRGLRAEALWLKGRSQSLDPATSEQAQRTLREALTLCMDAGRTLQAAQFTQTLAISAAQASKHGEATELFKQSLALHRELGHRRGQASCVANLGLLAVQAGRFQDAQAHLGDALRLSRRLGSERNIGILLMNLGTTALMLGERDAALAYATDAAEHLGALGNAYYAGTAWRALGSTLHLMGRLDEADRAQERARAVLADDEGGWMIASVTGCQAALAADRDSLVESDMRLGEIEGSIEDPSGRAFLSLCRGHVDLAQARAMRAAGEDEEARRLRDRAAHRLATGGREDAPSVDAPQEATNRVAGLVLQRALAAYDGGAGIR